MEKKNMEKIDKLYDLVVAKEDALRERLKSIEESLYTDEMKKIMEVLIDHCKREITIGNDDTNKVHVKLKFVSSSSFGGKEWKLTYKCGNDKKIIPYGLPSKDYTDNMIYNLQQHIETAKEIEQRLIFIEDHMEEFITKIGEYYREFAEKESDRLDALLAEMDYETTPTKHLKVTVEWV